MATARIGPAWTSAPRMDWGAPRLGLFVCLVVLVVLPGCGGCRWFSSKPETDAEKALAERREKMRKKPPKPDYELGFGWPRADAELEEGEPWARHGPLMAAQPHEAKPRSCFVKPGHWTLATMPAKANNFDMVGELETTVADGKGDAMGLLGLPFTLTTARPAALQKGQPKRLETELFVPPNGRQPQLLCTMSARLGARGGRVEGDPINRMPAYQYHFVVLASSPELYAYVKDLDPIKRPNDLEFNDPSQAYYRVWLLESGRRVALPSHGLFWTSIAYLLWDGADPDRLSLDQQLALLDWLHWGGQLIVSGPDTLDALAGSFLAPYLPVTASKTRQLAAADLEELNQRWTLPETFVVRRLIGSGQSGDGESRVNAVTTNVRPGVPLVPLRPWTGVAWEKDPATREVPGTGGLVVERRVGRGRVVVSAFRLSQREFTAWPSRHSFFNGCLLGRPPRVFSVSTEEGRASVTWADGRLASRQRDPLLVAKLRYFARDYGRPATRGSRRPEDPWPTAPGQPWPNTLGGPPDYDPGVAGWSDFGPVARAARDALTTAAQIEIPDRRFVVWVLAVYLVVLVPLNWAFFRLIGRVEWAWVAAPAIALVCTATVIRMARLDIGFARSLTEVDVVELQGDYPRAHVARYLAMYTSLATSYQLHSDDPGVQMLPFADDNEEGRGPDGKPDRLLSANSELQCDYGADTTLRGFRIMSNTADMAHTEQMLEMGGAVGLVDDGSGPPRVVNGTQFTIRDTGVMRRDDQGGLETAWLGTLRPGASATARFRPAAAASDGESLWQEQRDRTPRTSDSRVESRLNLRGLCLLAEDRAAKVDATSKLGAGDVRLIGWMGEPLPGLDVHPAAPQARRAALVVANLQYGFDPDPRPDRNTYTQVEQE